MSAQKLFYQDYASPSGGGDDLVTMLEGSGTFDPTLYTVSDFPFNFELQQQPAPVQPSFVREVIDRVVGETPQGEVG